MGISSMFVSISLIFSLFLFICFLLFFLFSILILFSSLFLSLGMLLLFVFFFGIFLRQISLIQYSSSSVQSSLFNPCNNSFQGISLSILLIPSQSIFSLWKFNCLKSTPC